MWRLLALGVVGIAIAGASMMLPPNNGEEQLRSLTHIAVQGSEEPLPAVAAPRDASRAVVAARQKDMIAAEAVAAAGAQALGDVGSGGPPEPQNRIVIKLQEQLRRVGCFKGSFHGKWDAATRRAMARFNDKVNAHLPLDTPNPVLLTLVEKYDNRACGAPCAPGTAPNASGICTSAQQVAAAIPAPIAPAKPVVARLTNTVVVSAQADFGKVQSKTADAPVVLDELIDVAKTSSVATVAAPLQVAVVPKVLSKTTGNDWAPTVVAVAPPLTKSEVAEAKLALVATPPKKLTPVLPEKVASAAVRPTVPAAAVSVASNTSVPSVASIARATVSIKAAPVTPIAKLPAAEKPMPTLVARRTTPAPAVVAAVAPPYPSQDVTGSLPVTVAQADPAANPAVLPVDAKPRPATRKTTIAVVAAPHKKKYARKSWGSGNTQFALGGPVRPRRHNNAASWLTALFAGQMFVSSNHFVASNRFVARQVQRYAPPPQSRSAGGELQIVLSNH